MSDPLTSVLNTLASTGGDPTMLLIVIIVVAGALLAALLLALDGLGLNRARLRHDQPVAPMRQAATPPMTAQAPQRAREVVGSRAA